MERRKGRHAEEDCFGDREDGTAVVVVVVVGDKAVAGWS